MWCRSRLGALVIGYNRHYQASEARRSAKYVRTNHRLRWPFCVLLWAQGATRCRWYLGLRDRQALSVTFEPQPAAPPACFVELHLEDRFPWYKDDSVLD